MTSKNARSWTVFYRNKNGRQKRLTLGRYPAVKLVDARELAREAQRKVAHGGDPVVEKRAARDVLTFGALAKECRIHISHPKVASFTREPMIPSDVQMRLNERNWMSAKRSGPS